MRQGVYARSIFTAFSDLAIRPKAPAIGTVMMILKRLRQATCERHTALECQLPLLDPRLSREDYRQFVTRFLGYYAPLETRLLALPWWQEIGFDYTERYKTPRLVRDMLALGVTADTLATFPRCEDLPQIETIPQAMGCLYVIEGATLGGQLVTRHLQANLGLTPLSGTAFFNGYGEHTGARWKSFGTLLTTLAGKTNDHDAIIDTANHTFETIDRWLFPPVPSSTTH
jgi:heme oxygenase (biliverdin-IX-beta and delta-forming)